MEKLKIYYNQISTTLDLEQKIIYNEILVSVQSTFFSFMVMEELEKYIYMKQLFDVLH